LAATGVTVVLWASAFVAIRSAGRYFPPGALALGRLLSGSAVLGMIAVSRRAGWPRRAAWPGIVATGVLWFGVYMVALNWGEQRVNAGTAAMVVNTGPILIGLLGGWLLREGLPRPLLLGITVSFAGVILVGIATSTGGHPSLPGVVVCLLAAVSYALAVVSQKPTLQHTSPLQVTTYGCAVGALVCLPFAGQLGSRLATAPLTATMSVAYLGAFPTAVAFTAWAFALSRTSAAKMGATTYLVPALAVLMSWALLGEAPGRLALAGGALCLIGVALTRREPITARGGPAGPRDNRGHRSAGWDRRAGPRGRRGGPVGDREVRSAPGPAAASRQTAYLGDRVLVTGVSGHAAAAMAGRLGAGGLRVRALVRSADQAAWVAQRGWEPVRGDLRDARSLAAALDGVSLVVHAAAYLGQDRALAEAVNVAGTRSLAEAALAAGVGRFVHISTMSVHGEPQPDGLGEDSPLADASSPHPYVATKAQAERALGPLRLQRQEVVVLRPGAICAASNSRWGDLLVARLAERGWPGDRHPGDVIPWVHTDDLAQMTWLAATHPAAAGQTFLAVDTNVTLSDYFVPLADALGQPVIPPARQPIQSRCRIGKIHAVLGYRPERTFEHTLTQLVALASAHATQPTEE
jgi:nucleoside-diphosphate-sugar epimerase/drug/metabolite transporter (DMT)-like permease